LKKKKDKTKQKNKFRRTFENIKKLHKTTTVNIDSPQGEM
jgi:hypothetical protein